MVSDILAGSGYLCGFAGDWKLTQDKPQHGFKLWDTTADYSAVTGKTARFPDGQKAGQPFPLVAAYAFPDSVPRRRHFRQHRMGTEGSAARPASIRLPAVTLRNLWSGTIRPVPLATVCECVRER